MNDSTIVLLIIAGGVALFIWNRFPAVIVGVGMVLAFFLTGVLELRQAVGGFGDPVVVMLFGLFVVAAGLEAAGVTTWAGQKLVAAAKGSEFKAFLFLFLTASVMSAVIGFNATCAALIPVTVVLALRLGIPTSQLMMPLAFAIHAASMLTLLGTPINVIALGAAQNAGGNINFFEFGIIGIPLVAGSIVIIMLTRKFLLPAKNGDSMPPDFSGYAMTLVQQYRLDDGLHHLSVHEGSPLVGRSKADWSPGGTLVLKAIQDPRIFAPIQRDQIAAGDILLVRGDAEETARLAQELDLGIRCDESDKLTDALFNRESGLAEVVLPPRSEFIGRKAFPGMATPAGDLMILGIQRGGEDLGGQPVTLQAGDNLLLQGTWKALDQRLATPQLLQVNSPDLVRRQTVALSGPAKQAIGIMVVMIGLLAFGVFPPAITALICACAMILLGVITIPQAYRTVDWNTCLLIGAMIPIATAMQSTGVDVMIGGGLVDAIGHMGPLVLLAGLFLVTAVLTQFMANTAAALVMLPPAVAAAAQLDVSPMPYILTVAVAAQAALLTPVGTPNNLMVMGPGGYGFGSYWKFGLPLLVWWFVATVVIVPLYWRF
jgi:di/tricarboxylate transporter